MDPGTTGGQIGREGIPLPLLLGFSDSVGKLRGEGETLGPVGTSGVISARLETVELEPRQAWMVKARAGLPHQPEQGHFGGPGCKNGVQGGPISKQFYAILCDFMAGAREIRRSEA